MLATPHSLVELDKNLQLKTCISLESESFDFHRLSLAEYPLYSGFAVLTLAVGTVCGGGYWAFIVAAPPNLIRFKCDNPSPEGLESSRTSNGLNRRPSSIPWDPDKPQIHGSRQVTHT